MSISWNRKNYALHEQTDSQTADFWSNSLPPSPLDQAVECLRRQLFRAGFTQERQQSVADQLNRTNRTG